MSNKTTYHSENLITQSAQKICRKYTQSQLTLTLTEKVLPDDWGRNLVWRYHVLNAPDNFPKTVIVKCSKLGGGHIFNDWASLEFLNQFDALRSLVPTIYGGDQQLELLVLEDFGAIRGASDLGSILEGSNPSLAKDALLAHARSMALLHATTAEYEGKFNDIRSQFPDYAQPISKDQFADNFNWFFDMLPNFGITATHPCKQEAQTIIHLLENHDALRAYTRGDVCPSNIAYIDGTTRFYDFEMGTYRSIFLSAAYFRISHLICVNGSLIPPNLQEETEQVYLNTVDSLGLELGDYHQDYAAAAAAMLVWLLSLFLEKKDRSRHLATLRQRVFASLTMFNRNDAFSASFPHLAKVLSDLQHNLAALWAVDERSIAYFPAFIEDV